MTLSSGTQDLLGMLAYLAGIAALVGAVYVGFIVALPAPERSTTAQAIADQPRPPVKVERRTAEEKELPVRAPVPAFSSVSNRAVAEPVSQPAPGASAAYAKKKALDLLAREKPRSAQRPQKSQPHRHAAPRARPIDPTQTLGYAPPRPAYGPFNIDGRY